MFRLLKKWWAGEFSETPLEVVLDGTKFDNVARPWPVRAGNAIASFYLRHWQWLWGTAIIIVLAVFFGAK